NNNAIIGKSRLDLFSDSLDARTTGDEMIKRATFRAGFRPRFMMAAMMAHDLATKAALDQPGRAIGTFKPVAADPAKGQGRIAASVEKEQSLFAPRNRLADRLPQNR